MNCICKAVFEETLSWVVEHAVGHPCEPPPQCVFPGGCSCEALQKRPFGYYLKPPQTTSIISFSLHPDEYAVLSVLSSACAVEGNSTA